MQRSQSGVENQNRRVHSFITTHTDDFVLFVSHAKRMVRFFFYYIHFFIFFLSNNSFLLQAMVLGCTCRVMIIKKGRSSSSITEFNILWYVDFQHFLIKLLFLWIFWLFCQDMYNTWLKERYKDDHLTHPDLDPNLWLEARLFDEPDRNWVYNLSHTTVRTYRRPIVFQPLDAQNRFWVLQLWNSRWF